MIFYYKIYEFNLISPGMDPCEINACYTINKTQTNDRQTDRQTMTLLRQKRDETREMEDKKPGKAQQ